MVTDQGFIATRRFGLGPKPGESEAASADPTGWLLDQIVALPPADATRQRLMLFGAAAHADAKALRDVRAQYAEDDALGWTSEAIGTDRPFLERLVMFWSNHFTVSARRGFIHPLIKPFQDDVIRPNVAGRFRDLLGAVAHHPAMLLYLDNARSIGPDSPDGVRRGAGLNENYGRELLELHTLGVDGGYDQDDVRALAAILTGWTIDFTGTTDPPGFRFLTGRHQPGDQTLLGQTIAADGVGQGERALDVIAAHPATARHVATRLVTHLVADQPPPALVDRAAGAFTASGGDLPSVYRAILAAPEAWTPAAQKTRTPFERVIAVRRTLDADEAILDDLHVMTRLGQPLFMADQPNGWSDLRDVWSTPDIIMSWIDVARRLGRAHRDEDWRRIMQVALGPSVGDATASIIGGAGDTATAIALVFASPEFLTR